MTAALRIEGITVDYGSLRALDGVNLDLVQNTTLGLVGESGSGKSTLARVIAGLVRPDAGRLELGGRPLTRRRSRPQRKSVQMVFQNPDASLNPRLTVRQMLSEALLFHRIVPRNLVLARCRELMSRVRMEPDALGRFPHELSGGQRQRIALARAISVEPSLLIADEPTSALDVSVQLDILELFRSLKSEFRLTVLFISHDLGVIHAVSDVVAVMKQGMLVEVSPRDRFFAGPQTEYGRQLLASVPRMPEIPPRGTGHGMKGNR